MCKVLNKNVHIILGIDKSLVQCQNDFSIFYFQECQILIDEYLNRIALYEMHRLSLQTALTICKRPTL